MTEATTSSADPMAQVVDLLRPHIVSWKQFIGRGDWRLQFSQDRGIIFGLVTSGTCELRRHDYPSTTLSKGDYLLMPRPPRWELCHGAAPSIAFEDLPMSYLATLEFGDPDATTTTRILGGDIGVDPANADLLADMLEPVIVVSASGAGRLATLLDLIDDETSGTRAGAASILDRLLEIMLIEAMRFEPVESQRVRRGILAGLGERGIAAALGAIHAEPARAWTVATLAAAAGMSRSLFAERFEQRVGATPIDYLLHWRMALARRALVDGARTTDVAYAVGYGSARAFSTAFTRVVGMSPTSFRQQRWRPI